MDPRESALTTDFRDFITLLNAHSVRYLLIGGYAVVAYGSNRNTEDIDFWFDPEPGNTERLARVTQEFGIYPFTALELQEENQVFQFGFQPSRIDLLNKPHPDLSFGAAWERRVVGTDGAGLTFGIISLTDLRTLKRYANRSKDRLDLEILDKLERRSQKD